MFSGRAVEVESPVLGDGSDGSFQPGNGGFSLARIAA